MMLLNRFSATLLLALPMLAAEAPLPELKVEPAAGGSVLTVKNPNSQPLSAFIVELVDYPGSSFSFIYDEVGAAALPAGGEKKINVTNMTVGAVPEHVKLLAAIYQDGATVGAPDKLKEIMGRRKMRLDTARELIQRIEKAQADKKEKEAIVAELREWGNSLVPVARVGALRPAAADPAKAAARIIILTAASKINAQGIDVELTELKKTEAELAASKPAL
jgi:hypothetical protein